MKSVRFLFSAQTDGSNDNDRQSVMVYYVSRLNESHFSPSRTPINRSIYGETEIGSCAGQGNNEPNVTRV